MMALLMAGLFAVSVDGYCWGQKGHDVTCAVAQRHLTRKAARKIDEILDGKTIVYWANWMDNASHTPEYRYTSSWHYRNTDEGETFSGAPLNENGDVVRAVNEQIAALKSGKLDKEEQALSLKFLVHLMGDLHCPMHMGHRSDRGGNRWQVQFFNNGTNLHSIWDTGIIESAHNGHIRNGSSRLTPTLGLRTGRWRKGHRNPGARRPTGSAGQSTPRLLSAQNCPMTTWANGPGRWKSSFYAAACGLPLS